MDAQSNNTQPVSDALSDSFVKALNHVTEAAFDADDESLFVAYGATRSILSPAFNAAFAEGNGEVVIAAIEAAARSSARMMNIAILAGSLVRDEFGVEDFYTEDVQCEEVRLAAEIEAEA